MKALIFRPTRNAMQQSGQQDNNPWLLTFTRVTPLFIEPLMGWTGSQDMMDEVQLTFATRQEAIDYAQRNGLEFEIREPQMRIIKPKSYAANFAFNRVQEDTNSSG